MTAFWTATPDVTDPASYTTTAEELVTLSCDVTALLVNAQAPATPPPQAKLFRIVNNAADEEVSGLAATTVAANVLTQLLPTLTAGQRYRLRWLFVSDGQTRAATTIIDCVE